MKSSSVQPFKRSGVSALMLEDGESVKHYHVRHPNGVLTFCSVLNSQKNIVRIGHAFCNESGGDHFEKGWGRELSLRRALHPRTSIVQPFSEDHKSVEAIVECFNEGLIPNPKWLNGEELANDGARLFLRVNYQDNFSDSDPAFYGHNT